MIGDDPISSLNDSGLPSWPITDDAIRDVFRSLMEDGSWGRYHGPHCDALRQALAEFHNIQHVLLTSSGTSAVELALRSVNVQPGDEVVLAAYDYKANFANILTLGGVPVLIDTLPGLPVMDASQLTNAFTDRTRAIICSLLHGCFAPMSAICEIARQQNIPVIEDACQAAGAKLNGRAVGSLGDVGVLSFGGSKLLTAGRGGAVLTNDATLAQRIRLYTQRGNDAYPLSEMQAAVLLPQLQQLPDRTITRLNMVRRMLDQLSEGKVIIPALWPDPQQVNDNIPAFYKVAFRYQPHGPDQPSRDEFAAAVRHQNVALDPAFPALHRIHSQRRFRSIGDLPNASQLHDHLLTLHHPILLQTPEHIDAVAAAIRQSTKLL